MVIVEQSDTIVHDYLDFSEHPDVRVVEFRTSQYGDERDKFVRLTLRKPTLSWRRPRSPPTGYGANRMRI